VAGSVLAVASNAEGGSYITFLVPVGFFCVVAAVLYVVLFARPHRRVPPRRDLSPAGPGAAGAAGGGAGDVRAEGDGTGAAG